MNKKEALIIESRPDLEFGARMRKLALLRIDEQRQLALVGKLASEKGSTKRKRAEFLASGCADMMATIKEHVRELANDGEVAMNIYTGTERPADEESETQTCFYFSPDAKAMVAFRCDYPDTDYVLESLVAKMLTSGLVIQRYHPMPANPMPRVRVTWLNDR